ncbi:MAG: hypothetical protein ACRD03_00165, partial [Acidimicrobiales bacterium]
HWVPDLVAAGGGRPVLHDRGGRSRRLGWEQVDGAGAEVVLVAPCGYHLEPAVELAGALVAEGRLPGAAQVWALDADAYVVQPGPRLVDGPSWWAASSTPAAAGRPTRPGPGGSPSALTTYVWDRRIRHEELRSVTLPDCPGVIGTYHARMSMRLGSDPAPVAAVDRAREVAEAAGELRTEPWSGASVPLPPEARDVVAAWVREGGYERAVAAISATDDDLSDQ